MICLRKGNEKFGYKAEGLVLKEEITQKFDRTGVKDGIHQLSIVNRATMLLGR